MSIHTIINNINKKKRKKEKKKKPHIKHIIFYHKAIILDVILQYIADINTETLCDVGIICMYESKTFFVLLPQCNFSFVRSSIYLSLATPITYVLTL